MDMKSTAFLAGTALAFFCSLGSASARADLEPQAPAEDYSTATLHRREAVERANRPSFAIELAGSPQAFGGQGIVPGHSGAESMGTSLQVEYQPNFIQRYGTLGLGPVVSAYPISKGAGVTNNFFSVWALGAEARYQARYINQQFLVPSIGYQVERMSYNFAGGQQGIATLSGPVLGLEFLLNTLDPRRGADFYETSGISHSYLVGEVRDLSGNDNVISVSGLSWFFGLRFEM
jgi:hypothetical protein